MGMFIDGKWHIQDVNPKQKLENSIGYQPPFVKLYPQHPILNLKPTVTIWLYRMLVPGSSNPNF